MPATEPERTAEAIRRALPELMKLDRYERRAAVRRARALRSFLEWKNLKQLRIVRRKAKSAKRIQFYFDSAVAYEKEAFHHEERGRTRTTPTKAAPEKELGEARTCRATERKLRNKANFGRGALT